MDKTLKVIKGLEILATYDGCIIAAEHDILYAGSQKTVVTEDHAGVLKELGWHFEEDYLCWAIFT